MAKAGGEPIKKRLSKEVTPRHKTQPVQSVPSFKFHLVAIFCIFFSILIGYGHTLNYAFHFDDAKAFIDTPSNHLKELTWNNISIILHGNRPVSNLTFALNYYFDRLETRGYHLVNIFIHFATTFVVYSLFLRTLSLSGAGETGFGMGKPWIEHREKISLVAALLWGGHPVQTQAVTYVVQRMTSLAALFYLSSLLFYIYGRMALDKGAWRWFSLSAVSGLLAMGTKENSLPLPFIIFLYDLFFIRRFDLRLSRKEIFILTGLFAGGIIGFSYIFSLYRRGTHTFIGMFLANYSMEEMDPVLRVMSEWRVMIFYISLLLLPLPSRLNLDPDFPFSRGLFDPVTTFFSLLLILSLIGFAFFKAKKQPLISFSILWFFINLAMESTFIKLDLVFEHRLYLPSVMLFLPFTTGIYLLALRFQIRRGEVVTVLAAVLVLSLLFLTHERNKVWKNGVSLWSDVILKSPNKSRAINNLGKAYLEDGQWNLAKEKFSEAVNLNPKDLGALNNLGNLYQWEAKYDLAIKYYQAVLDLDRENPPSLNNLGMAYLSLGKIDMALQKVLEAVRIDRNFTDGHHSLGLIYMLLNQPDRSLVEFQKTIELNPKHPMAHTNLGILYQSQGKMKEAVDELNAGLILNPRSSYVQFNYGNLMDILGRRNEAVSHYEEGIKWATPKDGGQVNLAKKRIRELRG